MIKKMSEFLNAARMEYTSFQDIKNAEKYIHNPEYFVYANKKLYRFATTMCSIINKRTGMNCYVNGEYGKINRQKCVMFIDRNSDAMVCMVPHDSISNYASLYYFKDINNTDIADFYMYSDNIGVINLIKTFCSIIVNGVETLNINESKDTVQRKIIVLQKDTAYAKALMKIKPGEIGCGRNPNWNGNWTEELKTEIQNGVNIYDISEDVEIRQEQSKYWKYFGKPKMGQDKVDAVLFQILLKSGVKLNSEKPVDMSTSVFTDEDDWFNRVAHMTTAEAKKLMTDYEDEKERMRMVTQDMVDFYKAKGNDKLTILKYTPQLMIVPGKRGIGKTSTVINVLQKNGLRENIDYITLDNKGCDAESLYNFCYDNNGKILILDDISSIFEGVQRMSFWQHIINGNIGHYGVVGVPTRQTNTRYYDPKKYMGNNRARYYAEAGDGSTMGAAKTRALNTALKSPIPSVRQKAERELEELEMASSHIVKPSTFTFTGMIIVLTNESPEVLEKSSGGKEKFGSIVDRSTWICLNPPGWVIWLSVKNSIEAQTKDISIPDEATIIPRSMVNEYIAYVESVISDGEHDNFSYRISGSVGEYMRKGRKWKNIVETKSRSQQISFE